MAVEAPADITILGLNRLSIEAGLYARFLGYRVNLLGHSLTASRIGNENAEIIGEQATTSLGLRALEAQDHDLDLSSINDLPQLESDYLRPLAQSDLLADSCFSGCGKIKVNITETDLPENPDDDVEYDTRVFLIKVESASETVPEEITADVLIDCRSHVELSDMDVEFEFEFPALAAGEQHTNEFKSQTGIDDFYYLGEADPHGSQLENFQMATLEIRDLYRLLGDSDLLDLYRN